MKQYNLKLFYGSYISIITKFSFSNDYKLNISKRIKYLKLHSKQTQSFEFFILLTKLEETKI